MVEVLRIETEGAARRAAPGSLSDPRSAREWSAAIALAVLFFMVTKGPVFRIRMEAAALNGDFIDDRWVQAAFVAIGIVVIALAWPAARRFAQDRALFLAYSVFLAFVLLSTVWSVDRARTVEQGFMLALGTAAALLAGAYLRRLDVLVALWGAMQLGVVVSVCAWYRHWFLAIDANGDFAGVYFNRNSLGPVAVLAAATSMTLALLVVRWRRPLAVVLLGAIAVLDVAVWWKSDSLTPAASLFAAVLIVGLFALILPGRRAALRRRVGAVTGIGLAVVTATVIAAWTTITGELHRTTTLSGRTIIWDVVSDFVRERPVQGWGFMAIWTQQSMFEALWYRGHVVYEAHSGYLEVLVGTGLLGFVALLAAIVVTLWRVGRRCVGRPDLLALVALTLAVYVVVVNLGESYVGANLLPWTLLAVIAGQVSDRASALDGNPTSPSRSSGLRDEP